MKTNRSRLRSCLGYAWRISVQTGDVQISECLFQALLAFQDPTCMLRNTIQPPGQEISIFDALQPAFPVSPSQALGEPRNREHGVQTDNVAESDLFGASLCGLIAQTVKEQLESQTQKMREQLEESATRMEAQQRAMDDLELRLGIQHQSNDNLSLPDPGPTPVYERDQDQAGDFLARTELESPSLVSESPSFDFGIANTRQSRREARLRELQARLIPPNLDL